MIILGSPINHIISHLWALLYMYSNIFHKFLLSDHCFKCCSGFWELHKQREQQWPQLLMKHMLIEIEPMESCGGPRPLGRKLGFSGYSVKWSGRDNITGREYSHRHSRLKRVRVRSFLTHLSEDLVSRTDSSVNCVSVPLCPMKKLVTLMFTLFSDPGFLKETHSHSHKSTKEQHTNWTRTTQRLTEAILFTPCSAYTAFVASQL